MHQRVITRLVIILQNAAPPELECLTTVHVGYNDENFYIADLVVVPEAVSDGVDLMYSPGDLSLAVEVVSPSSKSVYEPAPFSVTFDPAQSMRLRG
ncbi:Uma2 family endonuclease [Nonomuraea longispora]|uniref:Uma2 family endonuclease n=1 Tax=Nonomuraea longispora TaxID=1848320 RepID=UPI0014051F82